MKHVTKQNSSLCSLLGKIGILFTHQKRKIMNFLLKKPSDTKHSPPSNVYYIVFCRNFLFQYSLIGIVKPKFTRRNEIWCRILEIEDLSKNVRKTQDRTSLRIVLKIPIISQVRNLIYLLLVSITDVEVQWPSYDVEG